MNNSIFDVLDKDILRENINNTIRELRYDYENEQDYYDEYSQGSEYITEILVGDYWGWKGVGRVLQLVYGVKTSDAEEGLIDDMDEDDLIEYLSDEVDWMDALERDANRELSEWVRAEGFPASIYLGWNDGSYCLTLYMDIDELEKV